MQHKSLVFTQISFSLHVVSSQNAIFEELDSKLHGNSQSHLFHIKHTALEIQFPSEQKNKHIKDRWKDAEDTGKDVNYIQNLVPLLVLKDSYTHG